MSKNLLIIERSSTVLNTQKETDGSVILEGVFTQIGVKNKNNRIYEEEEVLPHINELKDKVASKKLLGELDHPKDFDISLSNVSHVIEDLRYDEDKKQVLGRIKLLNTSKGKEAKALIEDGIPLHISSRAAGTVGNDGRVKIKKFFTYDLVADPGFENAELARVNESFGFDTDDSLYIYEVNEQINKPNKKSEEMAQEQYVTVEDFNKYTEYLKNEIERVKETANDDQSATIQKLVEYSEHIAEKVNQVTDYVEYVAENVDKSISYTDYLAENINNIKEYTDYLAEQLDTSIQYSEHVAEKTDQSIEYSNYLGENLEKGIAYSEYIAEKLDKSIAYSEYLKENVEKGISYTEYVAEEVNNEYGKILAEKAAAAGSTDAKIVVESDDSYKANISEKLTALVEKAESKNNHNLFFMNFLTEKKRNEFGALNTEKQDKIVEQMNSNRCMSTLDAERIWDSCFVTESNKLDVVDNMPEKYRSKWESLSESKKNQILAESQFRSLDTQYAINNFWATRDLRDTKVELEKINESKVAGEDVQNPYAVNEDFKNDLVNRLRFNLGR